MKKCGILLLLVMLLVSVTACNNENSAQPNVTATQSPVDVKTEGDMSDDLIDFTTLGEMMAYAELTNISYDPEPYAGKRVKMQGQFFNYATSEMEKSNMWCMQYDSTGCCVVGFRFELAQPIPFEQLPADNTMIEVEGVLTYYDVEGMKVAYLENTTMAPISALH